jgi:hypothetical protein
MENIINYINSFFYKDENLNIFDSINFENTNTSNIINLLNDIKYYKNPEQIYNIKLYYENIYNKDPLNNLSKLKYKLILYLYSEKDKTENIINEIKKYKDPELFKLEKKFNKLKESVDYTLLELRYNKLINKDDNKSYESDIKSDIESDDDDDNNNDNLNGILVKKKIKILL